MQLRFRNDLLKALREYFHAEGVLEVTTPLLRPYGSSEAHLGNIEVAGFGYLQTSPEHAMKCLLAQHGVSLFQICPAFRSGETGRRHSVEFQMLEWYRVGFSLVDLMDDLEALMTHLAGRLGAARPVRRPQRVSYRSLFEARFRLNPHRAGLHELKAAAAPTAIRHLGESATIADYLDALFATQVEPHLTEPTIVFDYPACQAALAEVSTRDNGDQVSDRFEYYTSGLEIANAYQELRDAAALKRRFAANNRLRRQAGKPRIDDDDELLAVVERMPRCAGIALGVDRLAMALLGASSIAEVR